MLDPEEWLSSWVTTIEAQVVGCQGAGDPPKKMRNIFCPLYVMFLRRGPGTKQKNHKVRRECDVACSLDFPILESPESITDRKSEISRLAIFAD